MIHVECAVPVRAAKAAAWDLLRGKVETPQQFVPRIVGCEIIERGEDELVRRVTFDDGSAVTERVVLVPDGEVAFHFIDHPKFEGAIRNCLFEVGEELWLSFAFQGEARPGVEVGPLELEQVRDGFARTVRSVARQIERTDQQALGATA